MIYRVGRYALAEVGFEIGHAHVEQFAQLRFVPVAGRRIRKVDYSQSRLPEVALEHAAAARFYKIPAVARFVEQRRKLRDVRVYPHADRKTALAQGVSA